MQVELEEFDDPHVRCLMGPDTWQQGRHAGVQCSLLGGPVRRQVSGNNGCFWKVEFNNKATAELLRIRGLHQLGTRRDMRRDMRIPARLVPKTPAKWINPKSLFPFLFDKDEKPAISSPLTTSAGQEPEAPLVHGNA